MEIQQKIKNLRIAWKKKETMGENDLRVVGPWVSCVHSTSSANDLVKSWSHCSVLKGISNLRKSCSWVLLEEKSNGSGNVRS